MQRQNLKFYHSSALDAAVTTADIKEASCRDGDVEVSVDLTVTDVASCRGLVVAGASGREAGRSGGSAHAQRAGRL